MNMNKHITKYKCISKVKFPHYCHSHCEFHVLEAFFSFASFLFIYLYALQKYLGRKERGVKLKTGKCVNFHQQRVSLINCNILWVFSGGQKMLRHGELKTQWLQTLGHLQRTGSDPMISSLYNKPLWCEKNEIARHLKDRLLPSASVHLFLQP